MIDFKKIVGQKKPIQQLKNIIKYEQIGHAYLFTGREGTGKKISAIAFAKAINCHHLSEDFNPCNHCPSCLKIENGTHPDFHLITPDNYMILLNQIQDIKKTIFWKPLDSSKKIYLIDDAHKMNDDASNSLLKILEEPPPFAVIILITDKPRNLLSTILSRCNRISFFPISIAEQKKVLLSMNGSIDNRLLDEAIIFSAGSYSKALELINNPAGIKERHKLLEWLSESNPKKLLEKLFYSPEKELKNILHSFLDFTEIMILWFRDILFFQLELGPETLSFPNRIDKIREFANYYSKDKIISVLEYLAEIPDKVEKYIQPKILLENFIIQLGD